MNIVRYLLIAALVAFAYSESMNVPKKAAYTNSARRCTCDDGSAGILLPYCPTGTRECGRPPFFLLCCGELYR